MIAQTGKGFLDKIACIDRVETGKRMQVVLRKRHAVIGESGVVLFCLMTTKNA